MSIVLNDNIKVNAPKPVESKYFDWLNPWISEAAAYAWVAPTERHIWLTININNEEWRWKDWVTDPDLVLKELWGWWDEENWSSKFQVTADFEENEIIDLTNGVWSIWWTYNLFWDNIDWVDRVLWTSAWDFFTNSAITVYISWQWQAYKSVAVLFDSPTSFHFPVPLEVGDYFWVIYNAGMWTVSQWFASAESMTYAEAKVLKDWWNLVPWSWYKITDYVSKNWAWEWSIYTSTTVEPLYLQAISADWFAQRVFSETHFNDTINYNFDDNIISSETDWWWDDSGWDWGSDTTISNVTATSFEINHQYDFNSYYYFYFEDWTNRYEFEESWYWTGFTQTDIWWWQYRIDILAWSIDLTNWNWYIEVEWYKAIDSRHWKIIFRRDEDIDWEAAFDFRAHWTKRRKLDATLYNAYNSWTSYHYRDVVLYWWHLYIAMWDTTGETPATTSRIWMCSIYNYATAYVFSDTNLYLWWVSLTRDDASWKIFDTLWEYDSWTETTTPNLNWVSWFSLLSEDVIVHTNWTGDFINWLKIGKNCDHITILWRCTDFVLLENSNNVIVNLYSQVIQNVSLWALSNIVFINYISQNIFYPIQTWTINNTTYCTFNSSMSWFMICNWYTSSFWKQASQLRIGRAYKSNFWSWCVNSYIRNSREDNIASVTNVYSYTDNFEYNKFGIYFQNTTISSWVRFTWNSFLWHFWWRNTSSVLNMSYNFQDNNWWSNVFYLWHSTSTKFQNCVFHDNVRDLIFSWTVYYSEFWIACHHINWTWLNYWNIGKLASYITFRYWNYINIGSVASSLDWGTWDIRSVRVDDWVQGIVFWPTALSKSSWFFQKLITNWEWSTTRMVYRKNIWAENVIDPTT